MKRVVIKPIAKDKWQLNETYVYASKFGLIEIPKDYKTNGANIPRIFWSIFPPNAPEYLSAAILHDYLCDKAYADNKNYAMFCFADKVFYNALLDLEINKYKAKIFYYAVRLYHYVKYK